MRYLKPDFYDEFSCLAGACPKTCCAGWQIVIDETSLDKYEGLSGPFGNRIRNSIDWEEEIFFQYGSRCAFLNEEDLCEIQKELGESYLCDTCKMYPRHVEEYEGLREYSLSLSCPKAAEMILENQKKVTFSEWETEEEEEFESFDFLMFTQLEDARDILYTIIQNRDLNFEKRAWMCAELAKAMQEAVDENQFFEIDALLEQYRNQDIKLLCKKYKIEAPHARYARMKREIRVLQEELEHLESAGNKKKNRPHKFCQAETNDKNQGEKHEWYIFPLHLKRRIHPLFPAFLNLAESIPLLHEEKSYDSTVLQI